MRRERWKEGIMGGVRRGFSFRSYLLIAWRSAAVTQLRFKPSQYVYVHFQMMHLSHISTAHRLMLRSLSFPGMIN